MFKRQEIQHFYQPVVNSLGKAVGFEALLRHNFYSTAEIFEAAKENGSIYLLDTLSIEVALETFQCDVHGTLLLNIFPTTLISDEFPEFLKSLMKKYHFHPQNIVFEINESETVSELRLLQKRVQWLRKLGFLIALDDVGTGSSSIRRIIEIQPDIIKMDRYFSFNLSEQLLKQDVLTLFINLAKNQKMALVLEGLERETDYQLSEQLGVPFMQGYYLGHPVPYSQLKKFSAEKTDFEVKSVSS
ncbi:EAL domain-containing protein [Bacillus piscicola]|uniref:EAL domain-containing protein n=1 Tax=Bacillus piscicola TaxID=1632684 RepID=UPI001F09C85A|nr:EAL domain-containing protein [Bacillus piscicola]